jgi:hypothetical protein
MTHAWQEKGVARKRRAIAYHLLLIYGTTPIHPLIFGEATQLHQ